METMTDLANDAFANRNYLLASEIYERCLRERNHGTSDLYFGYGDSLARSGRIREAFDVHSHISNIFQYVIPLDKLKHLTHSLLESIITTSRRHSSTNCNEVSDSLNCSICLDVLKCPVTAPCGHTFCRQCCFGRTQCIQCNEKFPVSNSGFEQDILVRRLVDKWWNSEIKSAELTEEALRNLENNSLVESLRCCHESLEKDPNSYSGFLVRSEVFYRLNHFQNSLADADSAIKIRHTSSKAYFRRAMALSSLSRTEEALIAHCVSICLNKSAQNVSSAARHDVTRLLQRILLPSLHLNTHASTMSAPYNVRKRRHHHILTQRSTIIGLSDCEEENSSCGEDDGFVKRRRRNFRRQDSIIPSHNTRLRTFLDRIYQEVEKMRRAESKPNQIHLNPKLIDKSDFDCVLCCRTLWRPVVTPCGHTYCWVCLDRCMDYSSSCPLCMAPLIEQYRSHQSTTRIASPTLISLSNRNVTQFLDDAMRRFIPTAYSKRQRQEIEKEPSIPIFICTTAFPAVPCPLFIYEPRYRLMVRRAVESGARQFGIVLPQSGRYRYHEYGTMLDIRDCIQLGDGCAILSTVGYRRFRVLKRSEKDGYDTAKIEYIFDEPIDAEKLHLTRELHKKVLSRAVDWYKILPDSIKIEILKSLGKMPDLEKNWETIPDGPSWVWWITAILPLNYQLKVGILGTTSLEKRLRAIEKTLIEYMAAQQRRALCVVGCEGLPTCQAIDCCQRGSSTSQLEEQRNANQSSQEFLL